jgi:hypothetical protein
VHKKIIKFCLISNQNGDSIGKMSESSLVKWGIGGFFTITVDNALANTMGIEYLKTRLKDKNYTILGAEFIHMQCTAHTLNHAVQDVLEDFGDCECGKICEAFTDMDGKV